MNQQGIKARELRIGNLVKQAHATIRVLMVKDGHAFCTDDNGHQCWCKEENLQGLPLTEEWVKRLGYDDKDYQDGFIGIDVLSAKTDFALYKPDETCKFYSWRFDYAGWPRIQTFEFVHELQNLFAALYGTELELQQQKS